MTLTVCLQGKDGIVVASDSRGTFGDPRGITAQNDTMRKLYLIRNVGILQAGSTQGNMIIDEAKRICEGKNINDVTRIMEKVRETAKRRFDEWFNAFPLYPSPDNPTFMRPQLTLSVAGYDFESNGTSIPRMYSMTSNIDFAPTFHDFGFVLAGVAQYALYLLNRLYSSDMDMEALKHLAAYVITETAAQDGKVGGPVQMGAITDKSANILKSEDILNIIKGNENKTNELKGLFRRK